MRHRGGVPDGGVSTADAAAWAGPSRRKKSKFRGFTDESFANLLDETQKLLAEQRLGELQGRHFVALYAELYFRVYGVVPEDLGQKERGYAAKLASDMVEKDFGGDRRAMANFVSWIWSREKGRERWRLENPGRSGGGRITWRSQFSRSLLADYRIDEARRKKAKEVTA